MTEALLEPVAQSAAAIANGAPPVPYHATFTTGPGPSMNDLIHAAVDRVVASGIIEQTLDAAITKTIASALQDMTGTYSEFGKALKKQLAESLACGPHLDLPTYGHLVLEIVRRQVDATVGNQLAAQVEGTLKELLASPPASIKLSDLVAQFIEFSHENRGLLGGERADSITLHFTESDKFFRYIALDPVAGKSEWDCAVSIGIDRESRVFSLRLDKQDIDKRLFVGPLYGFERLLFCLQASKTPIEFDVDPSDIDLSYPESDM